MFLAGEVDAFVCAAVYGSRVVLGGSDGCVYLFDAAEFEGTSIAASSELSQSPGNHWHNQQRRSIRTLYHH